MQKANISWTTKQIEKMVKNNLIKFDNVIQRSYVWEQTRKSLLIASLIEGYPVPPFYASKVDGKIYDFLDGKQRINAICDYINDKYSLEGLREITYTDDNGEVVTEDLNGCKFSVLPEALRDTILSYNLLIYYYENITNGEVRELFRRLNNGKPLSAKEKNIASCIDIDEISKLGQHSVFSEILTEKGIESRKQIPIIMKVWAMLNLDIKDVSFNTNDFNELMSETVTTEEQRKEIVACLDRFEELLEEVFCRYRGSQNYAKIILKRIKSETHFVSLMPLVRDTMNEGMSAEKLAEFVSWAFVNALVSDEYEAASLAGSAKTANIVKRDEELRKSFERYLEEERRHEAGEDECDDEKEEDYGEPIHYHLEVIEED